MCWPVFGLQRFMLQDILRRVRDTLGLQFLHSTLPLVLMGIHNLVTSAIWIEVIIFYVTLYMWFTSVINPRVLCVSAYRSRDDTKAQRLDPFGSGRYKMVSEHMLTIGRDPRNWQAIGKDFFSTTFFSKMIFYLSSLLSLFKYSLLVRPYPFPLLTRRGFDRWDHSKKYKILDN